jgi:hypothetical protein
MLSREDVNTKVRNKQTYWEAMVRNNYQMPTLKSQIVTIKWMQGIREGKYWCPRNNRPIHFQIASMPTKQQLADFLMEVIEDHIDADETLSANECQALMRTADLVLLKPPDAQWIINTIGSLNSAHAIFQRDYVNIKPVPNRPQFRF